MRFFSIATRILEYAPQVIDLVERFFPKGSGPQKRVAAAQEIVELIKEVLRNGGLGQLGGLKSSDFRALSKAIVNEEEFVERVAAVNDAIVALNNYVLQFKENEPAPSAPLGLVEPAANRELN